MTLQQLKYVIEVADKGSINEAAKSLFISQPSLSNSIRLLEEELSIKIFMRTNRGIKISLEGVEFLSFAEQVVQKIELMEKKYKKASMVKKYFSISAQHNELAANAFTKFVKTMGDVNYDLTFRELKLLDVIEDVKNLRSEIGVLYFSNDSCKVFKNIVKENNLIYKELFVTKPHVLLYKEHPLANRTIIKLNDLREYPCLAFDQGEHYNSSNILEQFINIECVEKCIKVSDRGSLVNCLVSLDAFMVTSKVYLKNLYRNNFVTIPLELEEQIHVGTIIHKDIKLSPLGESFLEILKQLVEELE